LPADLVIVGIGVPPCTELAECAGLKADRGVVVNEWLETSAPGTFAAGDIARWPDARTGEGLRIEHWVVAERQSQTAARNIASTTTFAYTGHAEKWDNVEIEGDIQKTRLPCAYRRNGKVPAVASIFRDLDNLKAVAAMERS